MAFADFLTEAQAAKKRKYKIRFHLTKGEHFMFWQIENLETKEKVYYDPKKYSLALTNAKLHNQKGGAEKINSGDSTKFVVAWTEAETVMVLKAKSLSPALYGVRLAYNPHVLPFWHRTATKEEAESGKATKVPDTNTKGDENKNAGELVVDIDKTKYTNILTDGSSMYVLKNDKVKELSDDIEKDSTKQLYESIDILS